MPEVDPIETLISEARAGSKDAFDELLDLRLEVIERVCNSRTSSNSDFKEAVANTLFEAWKSIEGLRAVSVGEFDAWLRTIARRAANAVYSRQRLDSSRRTLDDGSSDRMDSIAYTDSHEARIIDSKDLEWALEKINPDYAKALILHEVMGFTYSEIADIQSISIDTVKSRIFRSKKALAILLKVDDNA